MTAVEARRVYVAGPYTQGPWEYNIRDVVAAADTLYDAGHVPFVPHTMTTLWGLVNPRPKEQWIDFDLQWLDVCDALVRLDGDSEGADLEAEYARGAGIPVYSSVEEFLIDVGSGRDMSAVADDGPDDEDFEVEHRPERIALADLDADDSSDDSVLYLTTLKCPTCAVETTYAHDGPDVAMDAETPWPSVNVCPGCKSGYPTDLGAAAVEVAEAVRVGHPEKREEHDCCPECGGDLTLHAIKGDPAALVCDDCEVEL